MFATIYLPDFYLQAALRHQPDLSDKPVALIDDQEKKAIIVQLNSAAENAGVRIGMTPSQGLARYLNLVIKIRNQSQNFCRTSCFILPERSRPMSKRPRPELRRCNLPTPEISRQRFPMLSNNSLILNSSPRLASHRRQTLAFSRRIWPGPYCRSTTRANFSPRCRSKSWRLTDRRRVILSVDAELSPLGSAGC